MNFGGGLRIPIFFSEFQLLAPTFFAEKDLARILSDVIGYGYVFFDRIREWNWFTLVYDNSEYEVYYCPELVKIFYFSIDQTIINLDAHQFTMHLATGDIIVTNDMIEGYTQVPSNPHHSEPLSLIEYITIMGARCT